MNKRSKTIKLFRYASIAMSLLSCATTYQGFNETVFASESDWVAAMASIAVQTVLLAGVLKFFPMADSIISRYKKKLLENSCKLSFLQKCKIRIVNLGGLVIISFIILASLVTSISFSYISIVNSMYKNDFAVNANIKLEDFMRSSVREMEQDADIYINTLRKDVVKDLKDKGKEMIDQSIAKKGKNYAVSTPTIASLPIKKYLIALNENIKKGILFNSSEITLWDDQKVQISTINNVYVKKVYSHITPENKKAFIKGIVTKINDFNDNKYSLYCEYYHEYRYIINKYNEWHNKMEGNENTGKSFIPSSEEIKSLKLSCDSLKKNIDELIKLIGEVTEEDDKAEGTTERLVSEAKKNVKPLSESVSAVYNKIEDLEQNIYGDSLSFEKIVSAFGSTTASIEDLENAKKQMLEMQGLLLQENMESNDMDQVTYLMDNLEKYVETVQYNRNLEEVKNLINRNYNIDNTMKSDSSTNELNDTGEKSFNDREEEIYEQTEKKEITEITGSSIHNQDENEKSIEINSSNSVITINEEEWTKIKKEHLTKFIALIFNHPAYLYRSNVLIDDGDITYQTKYDRIKSSAYRYRKDYLDTSAAEKAYNLSMGKKAYFEYKGKAKLSLFIAIFLDVGAFCIGGLMYYFEKHISFIVRLKNKVIFKDRTF